MASGIVIRISEPGSAAAKPSAGPKLTVGSYWKRCTLARSSSTKNTRPGPDVGPSPGTVNVTEDTFVPIVPESVQTSQVSLVVGGGPPATDVPPFSLPT